MGQLTEVRSAVPTALRAATLLVALTTKHTQIQIGVGDSKQWVSTHLGWAQDMGWITKEERLQATEAASSPSANDYDNYNNYKYNNYNNY